MDEFTITRQIAAPVETVWALLDDFGGIANWNSGLKASELTLHYSYTANLFGRLVKRTTDKQMRNGIGGLAKEIQQESERLAAG